MPRPGKNARRTDRQPGTDEERKQHADPHARHAKKADKRPKAARGERRDPNWLDVSLTRVRAHGRFAVAAAFAIALTYVFRGARDDGKDRRPAPAVSPGDVLITAGRPRSRSITFTFHIVIEDGATPVHSSSGDSLPVGAGASQPSRPVSHQP